MVPEDEKLGNVIKNSFKSIVATTRLGVGGSAQAPVLFTACWRFAMVTPIMVPAGKKA